MVEFALAAETASCLAIDDSNWHRRIREELRFSGDGAMSTEDPQAVEDYFKLGYRGARYSFGYGACPISRIG